MSTEAATSKRGIPAMDVIVRFIIYLFFFLFLIKKSLRRPHCQVLNIIIFEVILKRTKSWLFLEFSFYQEQVNNDHFSI